MSYPVFIISHNRLTSLRDLLSWLEKVGNAGEVYLMDTASTYPPLLEFYEECPYVVLSAGDNAGHTVGWKKGYLNKYAAGRHFILSDPDVVPVDSCPNDAIDVMRQHLDADPQALKAGFSLKIDDLPDHYGRKGAAINHESQFWKEGAKDTSLARHQPIDTTFALYQPRAATSPHSISPAYRLKPPYTARHMAWYVNTSDLSAEETFYRQQADPKITTWAR